jgi:hypothetical protein
MIKVPVFLASLIASRKKIQKRFTKNIIYIYMTRFLFRTVGRQEGGEGANKAKCQVANKRLFDDHRTAGEFSTTEQLCPSRRTKISNRATCTGSEVARK